ncbi:MAG: hypothetical protein SGI71_04330 [Verrucomicrobiota bacterium]|nr:hypothetical protein [Verrucomicrobiota bacterium]
MRIVVSQKLKELQKKVQDSCKVFILEVSNGSDVTDRYYFGTFAEREEFYQNSMHSPKNFDPRKDKFTLDAKTIPLAEIKKLVGNAHKSFISNLAKHIF